jgi:hypothetical protein
VLQAVYSALTPTPMNHGSHLAASLLQHLSIPHRLVNLWEDPDFACDRNGESFMGQKD